MTTIKDYLRDMANDIIKNDREEYNEDSYITRMEDIGEVIEEYADKIKTLLERTVD